MYNGMNLIGIQCRLKHWQFQNTIVLPQSMHTCIYILHNDVFEKQIYIFLFSQTFIKAIMYFKWIIYFFYKKSYHFFKFMISYYYLILAKCAMVVYVIRITYKDDNKIKCDI